VHHTVSHRGNPEIFWDKTRWAADHRDAPAISERPVADINDVYAFLAPDDPDQLVLAMTVNPVSDPGFAPTYAFSRKVLYRFQRPILAACDETIQDRPSKDGIWGTSV
jgi:hypothetical protein